MLHTWNYSQTTQVTNHSLEAQVGNTPLLALHNTAVKMNLPPAVKLYGKAEWFNPSGSVKDRAALHIIRTAEEEGKLWPGMTLLDSTSGNMGIAYAMFATLRGYKLKIVLPENATPERIAILQAYGAELVFTDAKEGSDGAMREARRLAANDPSLFYANQYDNPANWIAYYETMGAEIWEQTNGRITHFVAGLGSGGTFIGTALHLRQHKDVTCISVQAQSDKEGIKGMKHMPSALKPGIYDESVADDNVFVTGEEMQAMRTILTQQEGLFVGLSAAAAVAATVKVARQLKEGVVVTILPDDGSKYVAK